MPTNENLRRGGFTLLCAVALLAVGGSDAYAADEQDIPTPEIAGLVKKLSDPRQGEAAATALEKFGEVAIPALVNAFRGGDTVARYHATIALGGLRRQAVSKMKLDIGQKLEEELLKGLDDPSNRIGAQAIWELTSKPPRGKRVLPKLIKILPDKTHPLRSSAMQGIRSYGPDASEAIPVLHRLLEDRGDLLRSPACVTLASVGAKQEKTVPALRKLLSDPAEDVPIRTAAATGLASLGDVSQAASFDLLQVLRETGLARADKGRIASKFEDFRRQILLALCRVSAGEESLPLLVAIVQDRLETPGHRDIAVRAIGRVGEGAAQAVPILMKVLADEWDADRSLALQITDVFGEIGPGAAMALPLLQAIEMTARNDPARTRTRRAIEKIQRK